MKNYWIITTEFPPISGGGISTYCKETVNMMHQNGVHSTVFIPDFNIKTPAVTTHNWGELVRIPTSNHPNAAFLGYHTLVSYIIADFIVDYLKKNTAPDYIETQDYLGIGYYLLQYKTNLTHPGLLDIPIVLTLHAPDFLYQEFNQTPRFKIPTFWIGEMEKWCISAADIVISPSRFLIDKLKARIDFYDINVQHLFNPFQEDTSGSEGEMNRNEIVFFGKLTPQKGAIEMFEYLSQMWENGFEHPIHVIGGGNHFFHPKGMDLVDWIKKKHKKHFEAGKIIFEGHIEPKDLNKRLSTPHVIIVPSIVDNLPYAVIEAMNKGKIVLGSDQSGHVELIENNVTGFVFEHQLSSFESQLRKVLQLTSQEIETIQKNASELIKTELNYEKNFRKKQEILIATQGSKNYPFSKNLDNRNLTITENHPLLSIVIPFYNLSEYIEDTLKSIFNSSYENKEVLVINDGSTESESKKLIALQGKYDFQIINQQNAGLSAARNNGAKASSGSILAFLDADDTVEKEYFYKAIKILKTYANVSFVGCWAQYFGESDAIWPTFIPEPPFMNIHNMINSSALIYKKEAFLAAGLNDSKMLYGMEDYESVIHLLSKGYRGITIPETLWNYRIRKGSMAQSFNTSSELYLYDKIAEKHNAFFQRFSYETMMLLNTNGSGLGFDNPTKEISKGRLLKLLNNVRIVNFVKSNKTLRKAGGKLYRKFNK